MVPVAAGAWAAALVATLQLRARRAGSRVALWVACRSVAIDRCCSPPWLDVAAQGRTRHRRHSRAGTRRGGRRGLARRPRAAGACRGRAASRLGGGRAIVIAGDGGRQDREPGRPVSGSFDARRGSRADGLRSVNPVAFRRRRSGCQPSDVDRADDLDVGAQIEVRGTARPGRPETERCCGQRLTGCGGRRGRRGFLAARLGPPPRTRRGRPPVCPHAGRGTGPGARRRRHLGRVGRARRGHEGVVAVAPDRRVRCELRDRRRARLRSGRRGGRVAARASGWARRSPHSPASSCSSRPSRASCGPAPMAAHRDARRAARAHRRRAWPCSRWRSLCCSSPIRGSPDRSASRCRPPRPRRCCCSRARSPPDSSDGCRGRSRSRSSVPLAAQLACGPLLVADHPDACRCTASLANLLAAPAAPLATIAGLAACLAAPLPWLQAGLTAIAWLPAAWIAGTAETFSALPGAQLAWWEGWPGVAALEPSRASPSERSSLHARAGRRG